MTTLTSKIEGVQLWAYDIARRPDKTPDTNGNPQLLPYTKVNTQEDTIIPVTQQPTESLNQLVNKISCVFDIHHVSNGKQAITHGIQWTLGSNLDQSVQLKNAYSSQTFLKAMFVGDDVYIQADTTATAINDKIAFTTTTPGIKIVYQTGIVDTNEGYGLLIFEVEPGYKIPMGTTIKTNSTIESPYTGAEVPGTPETYQVTTEMLPGKYEIVITGYPYQGLLACSVDFATVQDTTTPPTTPTPTPTIPFVQQLNNVKSNITGASISRNLNAISLTANQGYTFQTSIQILFYSGGKVLIDYNVPGNNQNSITIPLNTNEENTITDAMDDIKLTASANHETVHGGYEHNYLISDSELSDFSKEHIWNYSASGEGSYDVTEYINNLIELPFKVNTTTTVNNISVGRVQSTVVSNETTYRFITLDLGTIKVPAKYNNAYDYQNKSVKLFTPFIPPITINNENAIEKTIHISYKIDVSSGDLTINLSNDNILFYTGTNNVASQIPFLNTLKNKVINRNSHFNDNGIRQPYIIVTRETPILNSDYYPTNERGLIKSYNGNVKVSLLNNMNIPNNELSALTSQLESGVKYVKSN